MDSATVVESVSEAVDVSPIVVCGKLSVAALTEIAADGVVTSLVQAAQSTKNKGDVRTATQVVDLDIVPASSRRHATRASSKTACVTPAAFSEQDDASARVSEYFDACPCTFLRRAAASVILSEIFSDMSDVSPAVPLEIPNRALFKASEVCDLIKLQPYVLRSWEAEFPALGVSKSAGSARVYRRSDVEQVARIKHLLLVEGLTLAGARRKLEEDAPPVLDEP